MRILIAHNFYQHLGGEDVIFDAEAKLLESRGHEVVRYTVHNDQVKTMGKAALLAATFWNRKAAGEIGRIVAERKIDVAHFHNTLPLISPAAYSAARNAGAAVVQTLHNYRLLCANALLLRDGRACNDCVGKALPLNGIVHRCYRGSVAASATVALMVAAHRLLGTWKNQVDLFIATSQFSVRKFIEAGLPADRVVFKPNFVECDPGQEAGAGGFALFVGRLSPEKGLDTLIDAWSRLKNPPKLKIIGDGPMADLIANAPGVEWLGRQPAQVVYDTIGQASLLVLPSRCYETFGRVVAEAFAKGTPVIVSEGGAMAEMVDSGRTGMLFKPGDAQDLVRAVEAMFSDPSRLAAMRSEAHQQYLKLYTAESNYDQLVSLYNQALARRHGAAHGVDHDELGRRPSPGPAACGDARRT